MNTLRELRRDASLSQRALADLLAVPVNTLRMWDSGLRPAPAHMLLRVRKAIACHAERTELMPMEQLARNSMCMCGPCRWRSAQADSPLTSL